MLKYRIPTVSIHYPIHVVLNKSIVKKKGRHKKQSSPDVNFMNNRPSQLLYRKLRNQQCSNEKSTRVIEIDNHFSEDDIDNFIAQEDVDDRFLGNDIDTDSMQFDFISNLPPFLKNQEGFSSI